MNILFFGSNSFISQYLVKQFPKKCNLFFFSRKHKNKQFINFNLTSKKIKLNKIKSKKIDYVFLFSSHVPLNEKKSKWKSCYKTNILGYLNLLNQFNFKVKKIIHASSCAIYGDEKKIKLEKNIVYPNTAYSLSKFIQENIIRIYCEQKKIKFLSYRIGYVIGDNMNKKRLVIKILNKFKKKKKILIFNKKKNLNLIHTKDIANIILKSFRKIEGIYNLTRKKKTSLTNFVNLLCKKNSNFKEQQNDFSPKKIFKSVYSLQEQKLNDTIKNFINAN